MGEGGGGGFDFFSFRFGKVECECECGVCGKESKYAWDVDQQLVQSVHLLTFHIESIQV